MGSARLGERASERLHVRLRPRDKAVLVEAASLAAVDLSELVVEGALLYAERILKRGRPPGAVARVLSRISS